MRKSAFEDILRECKDRVFSYSFYVLGNREDAEDVTQEVFVRLWENMKVIDSERYRAWIMRVAHNLCIDRVREYGKMYNGPLDFDRMRTDDVAGRSESCAVPGSGLEFAETRRTLQRALRDLPAKTRSLLLLHYHHGLKYKAIAVMLDISVGEIKVEVHRGRKKLKDILVSKYPEEAERA